MLTKIIWSWELPEYIDGTAVVCDAWGATTNISTLLAKEVKELFIVNKDNVEKAKDRYKDSLVIGESMALPKNFFDVSNYPYDVSKAEAKDKTVLFMSSNGSRVIELAFKKKAKKVLTVSFSNLRSMGKYLKNSKENIYLIPSGENSISDPKVIEDLICVEDLDKIIKGETVELKRSHDLAKAFIRKIYGHQNFDQEANFEVVFNMKNLDVIPICSWEKDGWIRIRNVNALFFE